MKTARALGADSARSRRLFTFVNRLHDDNAALECARERSSSKTSQADELRRTMSRRDESRAAR